MYIDNDIGSPELRKRVRDVILTLGKRFSANTGNKNVLSGKKLEYMVTSLLGFYFTLGPVFSVNRKKRINNLVKKIEDLHGFICEEFNKREICCLELITTPKAYEEKGVRNLLFCSAAMEDMVSVIKKRFINKKETTGHKHNVVLKYLITELACQFELITGKKPGVGNKNNKSHFSDFVDDILVALNYKLIGNKGGDGNLYYFIGTYVLPYYKKIRSNMLEGYKNIKF